MEHHAKSIRAFLGAQNFEESREFYRDLGFHETIISRQLSYFNVSDAIGFYLQDYYVKDWVNNSMIFLEVDDVGKYLDSLQNLQLIEKYPTVKLSEIREEVWGRECFMHDPSGILWHFGQFK